MEHRVVKLSIFLVNKLLPSFLEFFKMLSISKWIPYRLYGIELKFDDLDEDRLLCTK